MGAGGGAPVARLGVGSDDREGELCGPLSALPTVGRSSRTSKPCACLFTHASPDFDSTAQSASAHERAARRARGQDGPTFDVVVEANDIAAGWRDGRRCFGTCAVGGRHWKLRGDGGRCLFASACRLCDGWQ